MYDVLFMNHRKREKQVLPVYYTVDTVCHVSSGILSESELQYSQ